MVGEAVGRTVGVLEGTQVVSSNVGCADVVDEGEEEGLIEGCIVGSRVGGVVGTQEGV